MSLYGIRRITFFSFFRVFAILINFSLVFCEISFREISLSNKRIYFVSVSQVHGNGEVMGRVCILRDITYYKNLDREKSDYVSNVSHDLRSPLTLSIRIP